MFCSVKLQYDDYGLTILPPYDFKVLLLPRFLPIAITLPIISINCSFLIDSCETVFYGTFHGLYNVYGGKTANANNVVNP